MRKELENRLDTLEVNLENEIQELSSSDIAITTMMDDEIHTLENALEKVQMLRGMLNNFMVPDDDANFKGFKDVISGLEKALETQGVQ